LNKLCKVAIFTSIRSEYGSLNYLIRAFSKASDFHLDLLVGGAHLSEEFGNTINEIIGDGHKITARFPFLFSDNEPDVLTRSLSVLTCDMGRYLASARPDFLIVIGDRFELLPVVSCALILNIPIAHISGGEVSEGAIDNQIRNGISKMSHIHFVATEMFKDNLIKMGEEPWRIAVCGELGLDEIVNLDLLSKEELFENLGLDINKQVICATFHPETIDNDITAEFVYSLLKEIIKNEDIQIVITSANFDHGGNDINAMLESLSKQVKQIVYIQNLGKYKYFSLVKYCLLVLGNSSSGLVEVQSFNVPVLNIGKRQQGRFANPNVYNSSVDIPTILEDLSFVLSEDFKFQYLNKPNLYRNENTVNIILDFLRNMEKRNLLEKKSTY